MTTGSLRVNRDIILATKRQYIEQRKKTTPIEAVLALAQMRQRPRPILNTMEDDGRITLIGQLTRTEIYDPVSTALSYVQEGVDALMFFTDHSIYPGDLDDMLLVARGLKDIPIVYQNYVVDEYAVISARAADASALVLYSSLLEMPMLRRVVGATGRWKMTTILQVEDESGLEAAAQLSPHAIAYGDDLAGNFQRSLKELTSARDAIPPHTRVMFMHSLQTVDEVEAALTARVHAIVVGDALLKNEKKIARVRELIRHPMAQ